MSIARICTKNDCIKPLAARGMCQMHYRRARVAGVFSANPEYGLYKHPGPKICTIDGCDSIREGLGLCIKHYIRYKRHGDVNYNKSEKHGMSDTPTYKSYTNMLRRCQDPRSNRYKHYGQRGIQVCQRWKDSFLAFYEDMGERIEGTSIDRVDVNGNYEKSNCRWATAKEQANNTRRSKTYSNAS